MVLVLIVFVLVTVLIIKIFNSNKNGTIAIYVDGEKITKVGERFIDINKDDTYVIENEYGEYNTIEIKDGIVSCIDANCADKICVSHGKLMKDIDNDMIICAPHKLIILYE